MSERITPAVASARYEANQKTLKEQNEKHRQDQLTRALEDIERQTEKLSAANEYRLDAIQVSVKVQDLLKELGWHVEEQKWADDGISYVTHTVKW